MVNIVHVCDVNVHVENIVAPLFPTHYTKFFTRDKLAGSFVSNDRGLSQKILNKNVLVVVALGLKLLPFDFPLPTLITFSMGVADRCISSSRAVSSSSGVRR